MPLRSIVSEIAAKFLEARGRGRVPLVIGPTCSGKTALALELAAEVRSEAPVEIISADAFQVYRGMDIGTAKPPAADRAKVPHRLIDILDPSDSYSAGAFVEDAEAAIAGALDRGAMPVVVGGSMMYAWALMTGLHEAPEGDRDLRESRPDRTKALGRLAKNDPESASRLSGAPLPRIIRALEISSATGVPLEAWRSRARRNPRYAFAVHELNPERSRLYEAINLRVDEMFDRGFIEEVEALRARGVRREAPSQRAIGYRTIHALLDGELTRENAIELVKRDNRRYAKRQVTWMRHHRPEDAGPLPA